MARVIDAILAINPSAKVVTRGSNIDTIEIELVAIDQPITGGSDPATPPITIF